MKKLVATALVLVMAMSFAACSKTEPTDTEADTKETTEATTASETEETTAETTEETAPAIPDGYSLVEITSDYLGVKVSYAAPKTYSYDDIKTMFGDEDKVAKINEMLDAYAEEYFNQLILTLE